MWVIPLNESGTGLNWDWIREHYLERASPEEAEAQLRALSRPWGVNSGGQSALSRSAEMARRAKTNHPKGVTPEQAEMMCDYYTAGNKVPWIAKEMGATEATVRKYLRDAGIYEVNRDRGRV